MKNELDGDYTSFNPCTKELMNIGDEIVISGIAGRFPESRNVRSLQENLMKKLDLITDDDRRWKLGNLIINTFI